MKLKEYLKSRDMTNKEFAELIDVSSNTISNYICCKRKPTLEIAMRIREATKGKVSYDDLLKHWQAREFL
jgi:transcriptional regulator with XRE-family HTH domain